MTNPFEDPESDYLVVVNDENQHSLWPAWMPVPEGWHAVHGPAARDSCLEYVDTHWTDMRPAGLARAMDGTRPPVTAPDRPSRHLTARHGT
ncbi:MbtH family protein [Nonomuraea jiangxiensis]|uniref:MbtH protein n=1 Tax=Nonomuraea jiangxiensis TaxID=633440 RepID=A0A1G8DJ16_9ACTN|nr:MbtH family protein [Nonomuraea jiangxiensis]SDH57652.1 MbtH protein [Nonomuraea jiangxiensis]